jgi:hypothetical protein
LSRLSSVDFEVASYSYTETIRTVQHARYILKEIRRICTKEAAIAEERTRKNIPERGGRTVFWNR